MVWKNFCPCVCVFAPVVPQELYTPVLPYLDVYTLLQIGKNENSPILSLPYILEAIKKSKKATMCGFFQSSRLFPGCLNDSFFQQSKLESLNMYTLKVLKLTKFHEYIYDPNYYLSDSTYMYI